ncbi:methylmalonate-semialdehyde dehydrogenase [acylating], mitochondrial isoform X3 [Arachis ipaensis]|uniref:methylmalonate-semialdehyde dehydrogenase [acylating], mitochondrial isoform X3 n=1 Tax=Arachis ipaensis TaxID=130454 RepID=UPI0007AFCE75|nr:methylmalonate-semialdehyde dehydrogenase [acylating], mitochondrial isoform X3 [Arachis ipaensis]
MTEAGIKPRQVLKTLKQSNLQLQSTPRHLYNLKAKIRQGKLSDKTFKSLRSNRSMSVEGNNSSSDGSLNLNYHLATQEVVSQVPLTTYEEFKAAIVAAKQAFPSWKNTPITTRQRIMFKLQDLIHRDIDKLAMNITTEQGKTLKGARGDVLHGLEMVEHACGMANLQMGEFVPNACNGIDTYCIRDPLGVCAGICPINFPAMTPLWMFPIAITCGNTFILKPCENNPGASMILVALAMEAGLPDGVLNVVHGTHVCYTMQEEIVNYICDDEDIKAVSFNGSITSNAGGINHVVVMPDASMDATLDALVSAGFRAAGERSMALNTAIFVGGSMQWEDELVQRAKALRVNVGTDPDAYLGPVISREVKDRICGLVQNAVENGARLLLDGRHIMVPGYENGNFVGPTILCDVTTNMECYKEEIFGPVLLCMQADNLDEAVSIINKNRYGNGASVFTDSGMVARKFQHEVEAVLVGINVPVPIPLPFSSNYESKASFAGNFNFCVAGRTGVQFCTQIKKVAKRWKEFPSLGTLPGACSSERFIYEIGTSIIALTVTE